MTEIVVARKSENEPFYAVARVEKDYAVHYGFEAVEAADKWARKVARRFITNQRRLCKVAGVQHEWTLPERCSVEEA